MEQIHQLELSLRYAKDNLEKAIIHGNIGVLWEKLGNIHNALEHHRKELLLSKSSDNQRMLAYRFIAECFRKLRKFEKSCDFNEKHLNLAMKLKDKLEIQRGYCNQGNVYLDLSEKLLDQDKEEQFSRNITMALENFTKSLKICETIIQDVKQPSNTSVSAEDKDQIIVNCKRLFNEAQFNIGNCYFVWGKFDSKYFKNALDSLKKAATYAKSLKNPILEGKAYSTIGLIHFNQKEYDQAEVYFKKDASICESNRDYQGLALTLRNIARLYHARRQYQLSVEHFEKAKEVCRKHLDSDDMDEIGEEISEVERERKLKKDIDEKIKKFDQLERRKIYEKEYLLLGKEIIEKLCDRLEDYEKAEPIAKQFLEVLMSMTEGDESLSGGSLALVTKTYSYLGIISHNVKKCEEGKRYFKEAMRILEKNDPNHKKNGDYLALLIDLGNVMDDAGDSVQAMADVYWKAFELGQKADLINIIKASLNNLEFVYKKGKDKAGQDKVKALKTKLVDSLEPPSQEEEEEDDGFYNFECDDDIEEEANDPYEEVRREERMEIENTKNRKVDLMDILSHKEEEEEDRQEEFPKERLYQMHYPRNEHYSVNEGSLERDGSRRERTLVKKSSITKDPYASSTNKKGSKKIKGGLTIDDMEIESTINKRSSFDRYNKYIQKHSIPLVKNIQSQLDQRVFSLKEQHSPNWAVKSALKALKYNPNLEEINLKHNRATIDSFQLIHKYSQVNAFKKLKSINFAYNPILSEKLDHREILQKFLETSLTKLTLEYLNLSGIRLEEDLAKKLFEYLNNNITLQTLKLRNCQLESIFPEYNNNKTLKTFIVHENCLSSQSMRALLLKEKFPFLKDLEVSHQDFYPNIKFSEGEIPVKNEMVVMTQSELERLNLRGMDARGYVGIFKEVRFRDALANLRYLDISEMKEADLFFEGVTQSLMSNKFAGMNSSVRISVFKANQITFTHKDQMTSLFKFISLLNFLQEIELQEIAFEKSDIEALCESLSNFCLYITSVNLLGSLKDYSHASIIKESVSTIKFCFADL